jgi:lysophospholipid acyltransferase (LPLAT)-like uncharacterized protein
MKPRIKDILRRVKNREATRLLPALIYLAVRILYSTMRIRIMSAEVPEAFHLRSEGTIVVFWHSRLLMSPFAYKGKGVHALVSSHGDGEIIANVFKWFNIKLVRGSSSKRGSKALMELVRLARKNYDLAITPDGPRGPAETVKPGVAQLARMTGRPVIPLAFSCSKAKRFGSWDRFLLPYPFSRGLFIWGDPLYYHAGEELEAFRLRIEHALRDTTLRADELAGQ